MPKKKPVYGDKRKKKPTAQTPEGAASRSVNSRHVRFCKTQNKNYLSSPPSEKSEVTSPTSETPEPVAVETEAERPAAEPGERGAESGGREEE